MTNRIESPAMSDYAELAEKFFERACDHSTQTGMPVGVVLAGVIFHLAIEAQVADIPELMLHSVISSAAETFRTFDCATVKAEVIQ
ncbi:hypothetical protein [Pseudomonas sp.]|uniref:hypothetical protein n=1 Tax=Pseudomonas sp. TaxID=306 RepID=UPI003FD6E1EB